MGAPEKQGAGKRSTQESVSFDRAAEFYDATRGFPPGVETEAVKPFVKLGGLNASSCVLEIGIGTGRIALPLAAHVGVYYGVDISTAMINKLLSKREQAEQSGRIHPVLADATRLPFPDRTFDAVIAVHIFHLIPNWRGVLDEVARVLKPGAPLMHGGGAQITHNALLDAWNAVVDQSAAMRQSIPREQRHTFLADAGWREIGEEKYTYTEYRTPQSFLDSIINRVWSHTWTLSEAELELGAMRVQQVIDAQYPNPNEPIALKQDFRVQAYLPPAEQSA